MRHLKYFESLDKSIEQSLQKLSDMEFHMDQIKDLFQEYADEYNIEKVNDGADLNSTGLYYLLDDFYKFISLQIWVRFYRPFDADYDDQQKNQILFKGFTDIDLENFERRLSTIGYKFTKTLNQNIGPVTTWNMEKIKFSPSYRNGIYWMVIEYKIR